MPLNSNFYSKDNRNYAVICGKNETRHRIYAGLCCYRWADALAPLPYTVVRLMEADVPINFYQALHYAMAKYVTLIGHSFANIMSNTSLYSGVRKIDIVSSIAMKNFFDRKYQIAETVNQTNYTTTQLAEYESKMTVSYKVKKVEDILDVKFADLYHLNPQTLPKTIE